MTEQLDMRSFLTNLCRKYGASDIPALMQTPAYQKAYSEQKAAAPGAQLDSLTSKALYALRFAEMPGTTVKAWCLEPNFVQFEFDEDAPAGGSKILPKETGVMLVTADGAQKFLKRGDFDGSKGLTEQAPAGGWIPGLARTSPVQLVNVNVVEDLATGTQSVKMTKESKVEVGGHNDPFPNAPTLENVIGKKARAEGWGAFKKDKKTGTFRGRFGDNDGENKFAVLTFSSDAQGIKVWNNDEDRADHVIQADMQDALGNEVSLKLPLYDALQKLGRPAGTPPEAIAGILRGGRILVRGQGSIFAGKKPSDFGFTETTWAQGVTDLSAKGTLAPVGKKSPLRRLHLNATPQVGTDGQQLATPAYFPIGDKKVYDIVEKKEGSKDGQWEISTLVWDEQRKPWFSINVSPKDRGEGKYPWNIGASYTFLDSLAAADLPDNDPMLSVVRQLKLVMA